LRTDADRQVCDYENGHCASSPTPQDQCDRRLLPVLEMVAKGRLSPRVILAREVDGEALATWW